jgi:hypothetical protein
MSPTAKAIHVEDFDHLPLPPLCPSWCVAVAAVIKTHLTTKHRAQPWQVEYILGMLSESYLRRLPRLLEDKRDNIDTSPDHLRWLWCAWSARILGWIRSPVEGDGEGFSAEVYAALRQTVFPFPKVERCEVEQTEEARQAATAAQVAPVLREAIFQAERQGAGIDVKTAPPKSSSRNAFAIDTWLHSTSNPGAFTSGWWLEGMRSAGYVDGDNNIVWSADPANTLKPWAYKHLLTVTRTTDPARSTSSTCEQGDSDAVPTRSPPKSTNRSLRRRTPSSTIEGSSRCPMSSNTSIGGAARLRRRATTGAAAGDRGRHAGLSSDSVEESAPLQRRRLCFSEPFIGTDRKAGRGAASSSVVSGSSSADPRHSSSGAENQRRPSGEYLICTDVAPSSFPCKQVFKST